LFSLIAKLVARSVSLQMFTVGAQLCIAKRTSPGLKPTAFALAVRYLMMPALAIGFVFATAGRGLYHDDPLIWFLLILLPSGPSAMVLASLAEYVETDEGPIAGYLTIAVCLHFLLVHPSLISLLV
jgi:auxin efflux carrier family protein